MHNFNFSNINISAIKDIKATKLNFSPIYFLLPIALIVFILYLKKAKVKAKAKIDVKNTNDNGKIRPSWYSDELKRHFDGLYFWYKSKTNLQKAFANFLSKYGEDLARIKDIHGYTKAKALDDLVAKHNLNVFQADELRYYYNFGFVVDNPFNKIKPVWLKSRPKTEHDLWFYFDHFIFKKQYKTKYAAYIKMLWALRHDTKVKWNNANLSQKEHDELLNLNPFKKGVAIGEQIPKVPTESEINTFIQKLKGEAVVRQEEQTEQQRGLKKKEIPGFCKNTKYKRMFPEQCGGNEAEILLSKFF